MELIIITLFAIGLIYWLSNKKKPKVKTVDTGIIHIAVENGAANKEPSTSRHDIINEAETLFFTLQKKYLYSPLPFKVLGDFYVQKGLTDKALEKYCQMVSYLNEDLSLEKLEPTIEFMRTKGAEADASSIEAFYQNEAL